MPRVKLTNSFIQRVAIPKDKTKVLYRDTIDTNLVFEVRNNKSKAFYYRYNEESKIKYKKLGSYPELTLDDARVLVQKQKSVIEVSVDHSITLGEYYERYHLPYIKTSKKSYKQDINFFKTHILPLWSDTPMDQITTQMITQLHLSLRSDKGLAASTCNKLIKYLSYSYNLAISWNIENITYNPCKGIKQFKEDNIVERYLTVDEIQRLLFFSDQLSNPLVTPAIEFLLLTGARKNEVLHAKWEDIDINNKIFTIPLSKSGNIRRIPISQKLERVIAKIPRYCNTPYIFPSSTNPDKPFQKLEYYWYKIRKQANLEDVRIHDLRHTFASNLVNSGVSLYEVQKLLGHSNIAVTQRYAHLSNESLMSAVECAGKLLE